MVTAMNWALFFLGAYFDFMDLVLIVYTFRKEHRHELIWIRYGYVEPTTYRKTAAGISLVGFFVWLLSLFIR